MGEIVRALSELQKDEGWLSPDGLEALAHRLRIPLHRLESVSSFYPHFRRERPKGTCIRVCRDLACRMAGASEACESLRAWAAEQGGVFVSEASCLGRCDVAPAASIDDVIVDARNSAEVESRVADPTRAFVPREIGHWPLADPYAAGRVAASDHTSDRDSDQEAYRVLRQTLGGSRATPIERLESASSAH